MHSSQWGRQLTQQDLEKSRAPTIYSCSVAVPASYHLQNPKLETSFPSPPTARYSPNSSPLSGKWTLFSRYLYDDETSKIRLAYGLTCSGNVKIRGGALEVRSAFNHTLVHSTLLPAGTIPRRFEGLCSQTIACLKVVLVVDVVREDESCAPAPCNPELSEKLARSFEDTTKSHFPNDVQLYFPFVDASLWTRSSTLLEAAPYFDTMLSSGFLEENKSVHDAISESKYHRSASREFDDSDDETDDVFESGSKSSNHGSVPFHQIVIRHASYSTYTAVVCWISTRFIAFAPLSSLISSYERLSQIYASIKRNPSLPPPASPKSVYRLAHYLEIPELQQLALASIQRQLTVDNVAEELLGDVSQAYPEVQKVLMDFAFDNWSIVKTTKAIKSAENDMEGGEVPNPMVASIFVKLAMRLDN